jgi:hypothetical protein
LYQNDTVNGFRDFLIPLEVKTGMVGPPPEDDSGGVFIWRILYDKSK